MKAFGALLGLLLASFTLASGAFADATPVQLVLLYVPNVSNTGTSNASGIAELVMPEGEVRLNAANLPRLEGDEQYVAWVVNTETNEFQRLAAFNSAQSTGAVHYENVLPEAIPNKHWNLFLVTVEKNGQPERPGKLHSIAGVFPPAGTQAPPAVLPNTGGLPDNPPVSNRPEWPTVVGLVALTAVLGSGAGYGLGRKAR